MQYKQLKLCALLLLGLGLTSLQAQESINATGGKASGNGGSSTYSVGQVTYNTYSGTNGTVSEGVQHPFEISVITGVEITEIDLKMSVYPNPTTDYLTLKAELSKLEDISYYLFDVSGKLLESKKIINDETRIEMHSYAHATYYVKIVSNNKEIKVFKVIKN